MGVLQRQRNRIRGGEKRLQKTVVGVGGGGQRRRPRRRRRRRRRRPPPALLAELAAAPQFVARQIGRHLVDDRLQRVVPPVARRRRHGRARATTQVKTQIDTGSSFASSVARQTKANRRLTATGKRVWRCSTPRGRWGTSAGSPRARLCTNGKLERKAAAFLLICSSGRAAILFCPAPPSVAAGAAAPVDHIRYRFGTLLQLDLFPTTNTANQSCTNLATIPSAKILQRYMQLPSGVP